MYVSGILQAALAVAGEPAGRQRGSGGRGVRPQAVELQHRQPLGVQQGAASTQAASQSEASGLMDEAQLHRGSAADRALLDANYLLSRSTSNCAHLCRGRAWGWMAGSPQFCRAPTAACMLFGTTTRTTRWGARVETTKDTPGIHGQPNAPALHAALTRNVAPAVQQHCADPVGDGHTWHPRETRCTEAACCSRCQRWRQMSKEFAQN